MIKLFTDDQFKTAIYSDYLPLKCIHCQKEFLRKKRDIVCALRRIRNQMGVRDGSSCSSVCGIRHRSVVEGRGKSEVACKGCGKILLKYNRVLQKQSNHFCDQSCSASFNNKHKKGGNRRSKLEKWLEEMLTQRYNRLEISYNQKDAIDSELDIFIPELKLAFELNGIFHYEPIYGDSKLNQIRNNDDHKIRACFEKSIELCVIDTSKQSYFKPKTSQKFLDIITNIIDGKIERMTDTEKKIPPT